jgi:hypothetical protein
MALLVVDVRFFNVVNHSVSVSLLFLGIGDHSQSIKHNAQDVSYKCRCCADVSLKDPLVVVLAFLFKSNTGNVLLSGIVEERVVAIAPGERLIANIHVGIGDIFRSWL